MFVAVNKNPTKLGQWLFYTNYFFLTNASPLLSKLLSKKYLQLSVREAHLNRKIIYVVAIITCSKCFDNINGPHPTQSEESIVPVKFSFISKKKKKSKK